MTTIELTDDEAVKFIAYQKYHDLFLILDSSGAFDINYGKAIMNIAGGIVQNIVVEQVAWKR